MKDVEFKIESPLEPSGDQPQDIKELCEGVERGERNQVLLGVTGSGKTFTMAKIIEQCQRPALIMEPNKILAAQLYAEMKEFFPHNRVEYFVSYYDYYQPEAYIPKTDTDSSPFLFVSCGKMSPLFLPGRQNTVFHTGS